ncbi:hypothetical protein ACIFOT_21145 [Neobacillus sp. NRS-1170]|uniref:hypothetical protein n=1 Tax=Neobacillus sp. NRS-1170 TaxID=3233898 RepID=UPI003D28B75C
MNSGFETDRIQRWKYKIRYSVLSAVLILQSFYFISGALSSTPGTFAWFSSETSASGSTQNATTSDLLRITPGKVVYKNSKVSNSLTIANISHLETNVIVGLGNHSVGKRLQPGESFTFNFEINHLQNDSNATSIQYRIKAFKNYVDETYSVAIDQNKLKATAIDNENDEYLPSGPPNIDSNQANPETENNKDSQVNKTNAGEPATNQETDVSETTKNEGIDGSETKSHEEPDTGGTPQTDEN